jgi:flagellar biosynthesis protein FliR
VISTGAITAFLAAFARASGVVFAAPVTGDTTTPARVRLILALAIAAAVSPLWPNLEVGEAPFAIALELATGIATGAVARIAMAGVETAGQIMGVALGLGFAAEYDPRAGENASILRRLLTTISSLAFVGAGGVEATVSSVATGPAHGVDALAWGAAAITRAGDVLARGLALAGPIVVAAVITNAGLALANRAAPALNVFSVSFAAVMCAGALVLLASSPATVSHLWSAGQTAADVLRSGMP